MVSTWPLSGFLRGRNAEISAPGLQSRAKSSSFSRADWSSRQVASGKYQIVFSLHGWDCNTLTLWPTPVLLGSISWRFTLEEYDQCLLAQGQMPRMWSQRPDSFMQPSRWRMLVNLNYYESTSSRQLCFKVRTWLRGGNSTWNSAAVSWELSCRLSQSPAQLVPT